MINYLYTLFKQTFQNSTSSFLRPFIVFILFGFGGIGAVILLPLGVDALNTMSLSISLTTIIFLIHFIYPGYRTNQKVLKYSLFKTNVICYSLLLASILIMSLSLYLLNIHF